MNFIKGIAGFAVSRAGILLAATVLAVLAVQFPDKVPLLKTGCEMWEPCKVQMGQITVTTVITPASNATSATTVMTADGQAVKLALPVNTSATTVATE